MSCLVLPCELFTLWAGSSWCLSSVRFLVILLSPLSSRVAWVKYLDKYFSCCKLSLFTSIKKKRFRLPGQNICMKYCLKIIGWSRLDEKFYQTNLSENWFWIIELMFLNQPIWRPMQQFQNIVRIGRFIHNFIWLWLYHASKGSSFGEKKLQSEF